jgi:excisionase family DNA binding protein
MSRSLEALEEDRYMRLPELARYTGLSVRTLQRLIADPEDPLPVLRSLGRALLVRRSAFDQWAATREARARATLHKPPPAADLTDAPRIALRIRGYPVDDK